MMSSPTELTQAAPAGPPLAADGTEQDVLVLGAGLGGLSAALDLSRRGWRVTIVEKEPPPWHRVGESFDWETPLLLEELGLDLEALREKDVLTTKPGVIIWSNTSHRSNEAVLLPPPSYMKLLRRNVCTYHGNRQQMDQRLLEMIQAAGCRLVTQRIRKIHMRGKVVEKVELEGGEELKARFYIDASGRARMLMRNVDAHYTHQGQVMVSLWRRHEHHYDGQGTRLYLVDLGDHLVWVWNIHVAANTTDVGMVLPAALYRSLVAARQPTNGGRDSELSDTRVADEVYWELLQKVEQLADMADRSRVAGPLRVCSFQNQFADQAAGDNWLAAGETAFVIDPISSGGVTVALRSGKFAARILNEALSQNKALVPALSRRYYHSRLSLQVKFINATLADLYRYRKLWNRLGMPFYVRLLVLPQFHINWLSSNVPLYSRRGLLLLRFLTLILGGTVRGLLNTMRLVYRMP